MSQYSKKCEWSGCLKVFLKSEGVNAHGKWFCCDEHSNLDPETKEINDLIKKFGDVDPSEIEKIMR